MSPTAYQTARPAPDLRGLAVLFVYVLFIPATLWAVVNPVSATVVVAALAVGLLGLRVVRANRRRDLVPVRPARRLES